MTNIAIIGHGFVGSAIDRCFNKNVNKFIVDPKYTFNIFANQYNPKVESNNVSYFFTDVKNLRNKMDAIFVCVPTPMNKDRSINSSIIRSLIEELEENQPNSLVIIKSTVLPTIFEELSCNLRIVANPEFLTEKNHYSDMKNPNFHVIGSQNTEDAEALVELYKNHSDIDMSVPIVYSTPAQAMISKYIINSFLSTKVLFFNEIYKLAEETGISFEKSMEAVRLDPRVSASHTYVPGPDEKFGYGGSCFPKDTNALYSWSEDNGAPLNILKQVIMTNEFIRNEPLSR